MARQISEIQSLPFYQIIGAPLLALVQGEAQACQATAEFIERIGFTPQPPDAETSGLGALRMVAFRFQKPDADGTIRPFEAQVPLLSLVPIPAIQIKDADLEFNVKVTDIQTSETQTPANSADPVVGDWLSRGRVEFRATMSKLETSSSNRTSDLQMKVKLRVEQADTPVGLAYLFRLMDQTINSRVASDE
jgi:hypothetical protein